MVRQLQGVEGGRQVDRQLEEGTIQLFRGGDRLTGKGAGYDVDWEGAEGDDSGLFRVFPAVLHNVVLGADFISYYCYRGCAPFTSSSSRNLPSLHIPSPR